MVPVLQATVCAPAIGDRCHVKGWAEQISGLPIVLAVGRGG
jgi:hypothetical protein